MVTGSIRAARLMWLPNAFLRCVTGSSRRKPARYEEQFALIHGNHPLPFCPMLYQISVLLEGKGKFHHLLIYWNKRQISNLPRYSKFQVYVIKSIYSLIYPAGDFQQIKVFYLRSVCYNPLHQQTKHA